MKDSYNQDKSTHGTGSREHRASRVFLSNGRFSKHCRLFIKSVVLLRPLLFSGGGSSSLFYSTYNMKCRSVAKIYVAKKRLYTNPPES